MSGRPHIFGNTVQVTAHPQQEAKCYVWILTDSTILTSLQSNSPARSYFQLGDSHDLVSHPLLLVLHLSDLYGSVLQSEC